MTNINDEVITQPDQKVILAIQHAKVRNLSERSKDELFAILRHPSKASTKAQVITCALCQEKITDQPSISTTH